MDDQDGVTLVGSGALHGGTGNDTLQATAAYTVLHGHEGDDWMEAIVNGTIFNLTFYFGAGNDTLVGSYGHDDYIYYRGDGHDLVIDDVRAMGQGAADYFAANPTQESYTDTLFFGSGLTKADVTPTRVGNDMVFVVDGGAGSVTVKDWFDGTIFNRIERIQFGNNTSWTADDVEAGLGSGENLSGSGWLQGTRWEDLLTATGYGTQVYGMDGDDHLVAAVDGGIFDVNFEGGHGDDHITGSYARDSYRFAAGDGHDVVIDDVRALGQGVAEYFASNRTAESYQDHFWFYDVNPDQMARQRVGQDLVVSFNGGADSVTFRDWFDGTIFNWIENFHFDDGSTWTAEQMMGDLAAGIRLAAAGDVHGTISHDELTAIGYGSHLDGGAGDDLLMARVDGGVFDLVFDGGTGNDAMGGSYARDTYFYERGDGRDTIHDDVRKMGQGVADYFAANPTAETYQDKLVFGAGIAAADVSVSREYSSLVLTLSETESITIVDWFGGTPFTKIERIEFADGTAWTAAQVEHGLVDPVYLSGSGTLRGDSAGDALFATGYGTQMLGMDGADELSALNDGGVFDLVFRGGRGDDFLDGSYARDFYYFDLGDGRDFIGDDVRDLGDGVAEYFAANPTAETYQDHLFFGEGIAANSVTVTREFDNLVLHVSATDSVTVGGWFDGTVFNKIEVIGFADGTTWSAAQVEALV